MQYALKRMFTGKEERCLKYYLSVIYIDEILFQNLLLLSLSLFLNFEI